MAISLSLVLVLGVAVWLLHKYAGLKLWHGVICVLFGFYLATSSSPRRSAPPSPPSSAP